MTNDLLGTTAHNRPNKSGIHYSAKGYDEYRADLIKRFEAKGFVLRGDGFINAFVDLTAYLGEVLGTYQNAYAQEIYLETAQLRESLFNFAIMVDYKIDPGAAATGTIIILAKPDKSGTLPKGFQISGKEEGAKKKIFFETDAELEVKADYNDFTLADNERYNQLTIGVGITVREKLIVKPGSYIYCRTNSGNLYIQVQSSTVNDKEGTTYLFWGDHSAHSSLTGTETVSDGDWGLLNPEARDLLKIALNGDDYLWLDEKIENIAVGDPVILKTNGDVDCYGTVNRVDFEMANVKTGVIQWISETDSTANPGSTPVYDYTIRVLLPDGTTDNKTFYALKKDITETREVTKLVINWWGDMPANYTPVVMEKSPDHVVYVGLQKKLDVETKEKNTASLSGVQTLTVDGDFSEMEKYRAIILHGQIVDENKTEEVNVKEVRYDDIEKISYIDLQTSISNSFTKYGVRIWGNVVKVTQGKTVPDTVLGSGRGDESYQSFDLPQSPLTYERKGREGIKAAVGIKINGLTWRQKDDFLYSGPEDSHYVVETDYNGKSRVLFGDGARGARLPTGRDNVVAGFRIGQGKDGNVSEKVIKKPTSKPAFLKEAFNAGETSGGSDPDTREELREKIPVEHLTFNRAVSLSDYADLALAYPGVGKAKAGWRWSNNRQVVYLAVVGEDGQDPTAIMDDLRDHLDARRDINQPLLVEIVTMVPVTLIMEVVAFEDFDDDLLKDAIIKALGTGENDDGTLQFFNFERLGIGMSIHKKDIYHLVEQIAGVKGIRSLSIERPPICCNETGYQLPSLCAEDVWIYNWELATLDKCTLDVNILQPPVNTVCETLGI